jgi:2-phosphoglycerate kinase
MFEKGARKISSIDVLCKQVAEKVAKQANIVIDLDGMDGVGKSTLGKELARRVSARLISLDDHAEKQRGTYVAHLRCGEVIGLVQNFNSAVVIDGFRVG